MREFAAAIAAVALLAGTLAGCGDDDITDPTSVELGETSFVFVVNPTVNDANEDSVAPSGPNRGGVDISFQDGPSGTIGADGVSVFAALDSGTHSVSFDDGEGNGNTGQLSLTLNARDLREVAVALTDSGATEIANIPYEFDGEVVEITSDMSGRTSTRPSPTPTGSSSSGAAPTRGTSTSRAATSPSSERGPRAATSPWTAMSPWTVAPTGFGAPGSPAISRCRAATPESPSAPCRILSSSTEATPS